MTDNEFFVINQRNVNHDNIPVQSKKSFDDDELYGDVLKQRLGGFKQPVATSGKLHVLGRFMNDCTRDSVDMKTNSNDGISNEAFEMDNHCLNETDGSSSDGEAESIHKYSSYSDNEVDEPKLYEEESDEEERIKKWNVFEKTPRTSDQESKETKFSIIRNISKIITYLIVMPCMLALIIISKGSFILAVANVRPNRHLHNQGSFKNGSGSFPKEMICQGFVRSKIIYKSLRSGNVTFNSTEYEDTRYTRCLDIPKGYDLNMNFSEMCPQFKRERIDGASFYGDECIINRNYWLWSLYLMIVTPYAFVVIKNIWRMAFKKTQCAQMKTIILVIFIESLQSIGLCSLVFLVLPSLENSIQVLMLQLGVAFIPACLKIFLRPKNETRLRLKIPLDVLSAVCQLSALVVWPVLISTGHLKTLVHDPTIVWSIPLSLLLVSLRWRETYAEYLYDMPQSKSHRILRMILRNNKAKTKLQLIVNLWKIGLTTLLMPLIASIQLKYMDPFYASSSSSIALSGFKELFTSVFLFDNRRCTNGHTTSISSSDIPSIKSDWIWMWLTNTFSCLACYFLARSSAKILMQRACYALPLALSTPILFILLVAGCELWTNNPCTFATDVLPGYLFYKCYPKGSLRNVWKDEMWYLMPVWWLSQLWIAWHIWFPKSEKLAPAERLFVHSLYDGVVMEQSLLHNRRRDERKNNKHVTNFKSPKNFKDINFTSDNDGDFLTELNWAKDRIPYIYVCATMWHETKPEMTSMLKSILKLDLDQCARRNAQKFFGIEDPDYYEFESHIFFDDAFKGEDEKEKRTNDFVRNLVGIVDGAASAVHGVPLTIPPPIKYCTPYGGRLEYHLPGNNKILVHLKDSSKIRHKKRWSQVMYMYYFLGHNIIMGPYDGNRKLTKAENTFILALDGDVDFEPLAVILLVDLMKRNDKVAAACGRIHPTGSGPMVWYQKFEYALGHWMQKATEHVIGCVLCSPGCFSMFRGLALMDENVMATYATQSTEPYHYIQYDQGEDRWLCTLLLQQGYRVEYSAASDSYTCAPEGLSEFFNQRRRWMPSTMANIIDLLLSWRHTTKENENISVPYMFYQGILFAVSLVGPGTIFLMIVGALDVALNGKLGINMSAFLNAIPVLLFVLACYTCSSESQLYLASILTCCYCVIQMLVLVGLMVQMASNPIGFPTTIFFIFVSGIFILAGLLHPQELNCLFYGFIYYLAIPSMYMLLNIYAIVNLHIVSWGTREVKQTKTEKKIENLKKEEAEIKLLEEVLKENKLHSGKVGSKARTKLLPRLTSSGDEGLTFSCGNCLKVICCGTVDSKDRQFDRLYCEINKLQSSIETLSLPKKFGTSSTRKIFPQKLREVEKTEPEICQLESVNISIEHNDAAILNCDKVKINKMDHDPSWIQDKELGDGPIACLRSREDMFFRDLIRELLYPLKKDQLAEERTGAELKDLRNKMSLSFLLLNFTFITVVFALQMNLDRLYIPWFFGDNIHVDPIGFTFMIVFGLVMIVQTLGMVVHRTSTFLHIMASTEINSTCCSKGSKRPKDIIRDYLNLSRQMTKLNDVHNVRSTPTPSTRTGTLASDFSSESKTTKKRSQQVVKKIGRNTRIKRRMKEYLSLGENFRMNCEKLQDQMNGRKILPNTSKTAGDNTINMSKQTSSSRTKIEANVQLYL